MNKFIAMLILICMTVLCQFAIWTSGALLLYKAKLFGEYKVVGEGISLHADNVEQCLALCNKDSECDSLNFSSKLRKCRLFPRCGLIKEVYNQTKYKYFTKRPRVISEGYIYNTDSDSCIKLVTDRMDFSNADKNCLMDNARLVTLNSQGINNYATSLLRASKEQYAWIGLRDYKVEGNPMHSDGSYVRDTGFFPWDAQHYRADPTRNCWALSDTGQWAQFSCKSRKLFSICQISSYYQS